MPLQELVMRMFDVQGIEIVATRAKVFEFLKEPGNLPQWAHAFVSAEEGRARLETPAGAVDVGLDVSADAEAGTVDWRLAFPDGTIGSHSHVPPRPVVGPLSTALFCMPRRWRLNRSRVRSRRSAPYCNRS